MSDYVGQQLGNYRLLRLLGEGGFAQVYLGEHIYLTTPAAIKILRTKVASDDVEWFRSEARTIARLVHPNIVRVLDFDVQDETPFLVLDYAVNGTLRQRHPRGKLLPLSLVVSYVRQMAEALQYAHDEKLIHRDVKPENMLLGKRNEVLLSDFGVALMAQSSRFESLQNVAGTISYMAPEQIQGKPRPASDQYSLGIVVYEWLSGERPFDGSLSEIISQHLAVPPLALRGRIPAVSPAVEQVVMRVLEKDPDRRFETVRAFAMALEQASQSHALTASPGAPGVDEAPPLSLSETFLPLRSPAAPRVNETRPAAQQGAGTILSQYRGHLTSVSSVSWSPDSRRVVSAGNEKTVHVWDAATGDTLALFQDETDVVRVVAWSPDGTRMATVGADAVARVWDVTTNRLIVSYPGQRGQTVNAMRWSPTQQRLASAGTDGTVHVWDATSGDPIIVYKGHAASVNALAWSFNGKRIVSGSDDRSVQVWEASTGRNVSIYSGQSAKVVSVAWSPVSSRVGCGREDGMVQMWDTTSDREVVGYRYSAPVSIVAWSPDERRFGCASDDKTIQVWDTVTNLKVYTFSHTAPVRVMAWSPHGKYIASGGGDTLIQVWVAP